jgi:AAA+ ATPase superfamily predicted ATPase
MFVGRKRELTDLNSRYNSGKFEFAVIYGRRRVGKTTLINEFVRDKECIVYSAAETNEKQNLEALSQSIYALSDDFGSSPGTFANFATAFETIFKISEKRRIVFVIDEYPYLAGCSKGIASVLQIFIDQKHKNSKLFLILCGSSMSFMENQVMGYKSPLYGRRTCQYKIKPFDIFEAREYFIKFNAEELAVIYGITGGIPLYMSLMDENLGVAANIKNNFFTPNAYLFEEPVNLIKQECRDASQYNSIITAIAGGASRLFEICSKTGLNTSLASDYLAKLAGLGIVKKETPFTVTNSKKTIYLLEDSMFRFWHRFVESNVSAISRGLSESVYDKIEPQVPGFMGAVFEEICKQYLWKLNAEGKASVTFTDLGRWWGNDPKEKIEVEIDILATGSKDSAIFGECKWTNEKVGSFVLDTLFKRGDLFPFKEKHFYLFSKNGFTEGCESRADEIENVTLTRYDDIFE